MRSLIVIALVGIATVAHAQASVSSAGIAGESCDRQCTVLRGAVIGLGGGAIGGAIVGALWPLPAATPIVTAVARALPVRSVRTPEWRVGMHVGF